MKLLISLTALITFSINAQSFDFIKLQNTQIEALEAQDGTYARFADIAEGFVKFKGVETKDNNLFINVINSEIGTIILQDGSNTNLNQVILNHATVTRGGDMGGGGAALILQ